MCNLCDNMCAGTLPPSWSGLAPDSPTRLRFAGNRLTGAPPASWAARSSTGGWRELDITGNAGMCGNVPGWFYADLAHGNSSKAQWLLQGASQ